MDMLTIAEICRALNVTLETIHNWRAGSPRRVALPVHVAREGGRRRVAIARADLESFLGDYRPDLLERWRAHCEQRDRPAS